MNTPSKEECIELFRNNNVHDNIIAHTKKVCDFSMKVCGVLEKHYKLNLSKELRFAKNIKEELPGNEQS